MIVPATSAVLSADFQTPLSINHRSHDQHHLQNIRVSIIPFWTNDLTEIKSDAAAILIDLLRHPARYRSTHGEGLLPCAPSHRPHPSNLTGFTSLDAVVRAGAAFTLIVKVRVSSARALVARVVWPRFGRSNHDFLY
jgi:hypothetical protein